MLPFAAAIFLGAFLLFQIEPILGKFVLPWFGGGPGVWATCLAFFQTALVAGYGYAHWLTRRFSPRAQAWIHGTLLAASLLWLPMVPGERWKPGSEAHPAWQILWLLTAVAGMPYVAIAATGPLLQEWYRRAQPERSPYRLYALSNVGSLLALLSYPFLIEWTLTRHAQAWAWAAGEVIFVGVCGFCGWRFCQRSTAHAALCHASRPAPLSDSSPRSLARQSDGFRSGAGLRARRDSAGGEQEGGMSKDMTPGMPRPTRAGMQVAWVGLPAVASALLVATTNKLCLDLAAAPFLWVLPLALYLLSFILCFDHPRWYRPTFWSAGAIVAAGCVAKLLIDDDGPLLTQVIVYGGGLLAGCMVCHGELVRLRPDARALTRFYLLVSVGGALGGLAVALVAPAVFRSFAELPISFWLVTMVIALVCVAQRRRDLAFGSLIGAVAALPLVPLVSVPEASHGGEFFRGAMAAWSDFSGEFLGPIALLLAAAIAAFISRRDGWARTWELRSALFAVAVSAVIGGADAVARRYNREDVVSASRDFFGVLTVFSQDEATAGGHYYLLMHGRTTHGAQFTDPKRSREPTTYYGRRSGVGRAIASLPPGPRRLGLVGLGAGTLCAYLRTGDSMRIYEIDPAVERLARSRFTYLSSAEGRVEIVAGDARLSIEREVRAGRPPRYDVLALDAFSSDAIPVHLLTQEAFAFYLRELAPDGILAIHISNRYFDLEPVVANLARHFRLGCVTVDDDGRDDDLTYETRWVLVSRNPEILLRPVIARGAEPSADDRSARLWTDDYSSLWQVLR